jgi:hypothetical protein
MRWVTISHPEAGTARVAASSVPFHTVSGWTVIPDPPPAPRHAPRAVDNTDAAGDRPVVEPPKVRRANKKEND